MGLKKGDAQREIVSTISGWFPKFTDLFDEETWMIFFVCLVVFSIIAALLASRFIKIKDGGHID